MPRVLISRTLRQTPPRLHHSHNRHGSGQGQGRILRLQARHRGFQGLFRQRPHPGQRLLWLLRQSPGRLRQSLKRYMEFAAIKTGGICATVQF